MINDQCVSGLSKVASKRVPPTNEQAIALFYTTFKASVTETLRGERKEILKLVFGWR
ncbi:MAG: hypothetical protein WA865_18240 [Spirulinaceae cyanobacterium]